MAHIENMVIYANNKYFPKNTLRVTIAMRPAGKDSIDIEIPADFYDCLMRMAQLGADITEQKMRAQILSDNASTEAALFEVVK